MTGKVYLVGAGPGDPGLVTVRAVQVLGEADVIVKDALVPAALLAHTRADAVVVEAGKRCGEHLRQQEEINALLCEHARAGKTVVRLKGGDPFVFGRGGEECEVLARAGIPFEIVPGVTSVSAVPAYAGIPLTHREHARSFAVVTGHVCAPDEERVRWDRLAAGADTLVLLMGVTRIAEHAVTLVQHGRSPSTPVAVVEWGTTPRQRTVVGTLGDIAEIVRREGVRPPAVVVVGDVVKLRRDLDWYERRPLFGRRVLVTRARRQASALADRLLRLGAEPVTLPTIEIVPPESWEELDRAIAEIDGYDQLVFTSQNGVHFFWERLEHAGADARRLGRVRVAAIGPATAEALRSHGVLADVVAKEFRAEGLVDEMVRAGVGGTRILVVRAAKARDVLLQELRRAGAHVEVATAYRTVIPAEPAAEARALLEQGKIDAITFTSPSTVENFVQLFPPRDLEEQLRAAVVACIGPVTRDAARFHGIECHVMPEAYTIPGLCDALADHFAARRGA